MFGGKFGFVKNLFGKKFFGCLRKKKGCFWLLKEKMVGFGFTEKMVVFVRGKKMVGSGC